MLSSKRPPFFFCTKTVTNTLNSPSLSSSSSHTHFHLIHYHHFHHQQQQPQYHLVSLLHKYTFDHQATKQLHSVLLTTGSLHHHHRDCIFLFNSLLRSYSLSDIPQEAFLLYNQLLQLYLHSHSVSGPPFDSFTYSFLLKASANFCCPMLGIQVQALTMKMGLGFHVYVQTALLNMYTDCGFLIDAGKVFYELAEKNSVTWNVMITGLVKWGEFEMARSLFEEMPCRSVVSWTGMIDGFTRINRPVEALTMFRKMIVCDCIEPTEITILAIFPAISSIGNLKICQSVHAYGEKRGFNAFDMRVTNAQIDAYAKCGCIVSASRFFEEISAKRKNLVSWTSIISGFAMHGMGREAVENFERMEKGGLKPNRITFLSVLNACNHGGLVEEGLKFFEKMVNERQVSPDIKHYGCLVDMLGRAGKLEQAEKIALEIPSEIANIVIWRILLGSCSFHGNIKMAERVTRKILEMGRGYGGDYVLMSNIFAGVGRFPDAEKLRSLMDQRNTFKVPGHSLV